MRYNQSVLDMYTFNFSLLLQPVALGPQPRAILLHKNSTSPFGGVLETQVTSRC
ncbi:hypothetical protein LPIBR_130056 [Lacticaseibacillus paracasei]|nr:hypothetical protein LPIBR_130056 [Lacticaseibacillus paracasei]